MLAIAFEMKELWQRDSATSHRFQGASCRFEWRN
jgi:hypothetical protein